MPAGAREAGRKPSPAAVALLAGGLIILGYCLSLSAVFPSSDFLGFYAGATLAARGQWYQPDAIEQLEKKYGRIEQAKPFHRPPFYALATAPLALLPYASAFAVWQVLNVAALGAFFWIWPFPRKLHAILLALWFPPLWMAFAVAQDSAILLAGVAIAASLLRRNRPFWAGAALAVCCFKANLLLGLPVVLWTRRMGKVCGGLAVGAAALYFVSAFAAGWQWPLDYLAAIGHTTKVLPVNTYFASLAGLSESLPEPIRWIRWPAVVAVAGMLAFASRRVPDDRALGLALMAGLLISPLAFLYDAAIMLPGIITVTEGRNPVFGFLAVGLGMLTLTIPDPRTAWVGQSCLLLLFGAAVWPMLRLRYNAHVNVRL